MRKAKVYYGDRLAGELVETEEGYQFKYHPEYLAGGVPIAFQFPLQEATFKSRQLPSFFENLAAEGWLLKLQSYEQKISENDRFGLLLANGRDLIGAVTLLPSDE